MTQDIFIDYIPNIIKESNVKIRLGLNKRIRTRNIKSINPEYPHILTTLQNPSHNYIIIYYYGFAVLMASFEIKNNKPINIEYDTANLANIPENIIPILNAYIKENKEKLDKILQTLFDKKLIPNT